MPGVYERLIEASGNFNPHEPLDPHIETWLRANIEAYRDVLPQWIAHVIRVAQED